MAVIATLLRRVAAASYDILLVTAVLMLVTLTMLALRGGEPISPGNLLYQLVLFGTTACFFVGFWVYGGQTLGMRAWRLRVEQRSGEPMTWKIGSIRFAAAIASIAPLGLGFFWLLIDPEGLTWHDRIAGTHIVVQPKSK